MYLFYVRIHLGRSHSEYTKYHAAMTDLYAKPTDYGGQMNGALVRYAYQSPENLIEEITAEMKRPQDVTVKEVTSSTLEEEHRAYSELISVYFLPHHDYPNILL